MHVHEDRTKNQNAPVGSHTGVQCIGQWTEINQWECVWSAATTPSTFLYSIRLEVTENSESYSKTLSLY